jgi:hypothetical protein
VLRDQIEIAREEANKLRDRIADELRSGTARPLSLKSLQAAERSLERAITSLERHSASVHRAPGSPLAAEALQIHV